MVSEFDQRALDQIDRLLTLDDPDLAAHFLGWTAPPPNRRRWPYLVTAAIAVVVMAASVVLGWAVVFWLAALCLGAVIGTRWWRIGRPARRRLR
ncbi:DUF3040 domain-containing protein [Actinophytocola sp.]|uniref:DUF3040 domain-containing protein n=1 Tax=Actinophytocola sp. TaxID=1872138 RepID=UPI003D6A5D0C